MRIGFIGRATMAALAAHDLALRERLRDAGATIVQAGEPADMIVTTAEDIADVPVIAPVIVPQTQRERNLYGDRAMAAAEAKRARKADKRRATR